MDKLLKILVGGACLVIIAQGVRDGIAEFRHYTADMRWEMPKWGEADCARYISDLRKDITNEKTIALVKDCYKERIISEDQFRRAFSN
jgi:hypothetical protein